MQKLLLILVVVITNCSIAFSQAVPESRRITVQGQHVKIVYGQVAKGGRDIFGRLIPYGKVWRIGSSEATEITFSTNGTFGGKPVKAGTYTLFTIPEANEWTFILNSELNQWGAYQYDKIKGKDVLQVKVPASTISGAPVEKLTISLPAGKLVVEWDKTRVEVPVKS